MPTPRDVALVAPYPPAGQRHGGHSGVASYTANLARALTGAGVNVTVVAPELDGDPASFRDGDVEVHREFGLGRRALPAAIGAARRHGPDVVHLQFELFLYGGPSSLAGLLPALALGHRSPLVTTMHQVVEPGSVDRAYTRLHRVGVPVPVARAGIAAVQHATTLASRATVVHEEPFRRIVPGATVIPHGIEDTARLDRDGARAALSLDERLVVLCFGFLAPYKGIELVLDAGRLAAADVHVVVAGGEHPRLHGDGYAAELRAEHAEHATFTGWVPDGDVSAWFAAADLAIFPYPRPFAASGVLALALAHGTPVLLSPALARCTGAPSVMVAPMEAPDLARRFGVLAAEPSDLDDVRRFTAALAAGRRWPSVARLHADLYEEVLDVDRAARRRLRPR